MVHTISIQRQNIGVPAQDCDQPLFDPTGGVLRPLRAGASDRGFLDRHQYPLPHLPRGEKPNPGLRIPAASNQTTMGAPVRAIPRRTEFARATVSGCWGSVSRSVVFARVDTSSLAHSHNPLGSVVPLTSGEQNRANLFFVLSDNPQVAIIQDRPFATRSVTA